MIEQVIEARAAKEGVDHIIFVPRVITHPKKQHLSDQEQAFCQAYWELAELRLSKARFARFAKEAGAIIGQKSSTVIANRVQELCYLDLGVKCGRCGHPIIARKRDELSSFGAQFKIYVEPDGNLVCYNCVYGVKSDFEKLFETPRPKIAQLPEVTIVYTPDLTITGEMRQFCEAYWALDSTDRGAPKLKYSDGAEVIAASKNNWVESWLDTTDSTTMLRKLCHLEIIGARCRSCEAYPVIVRSRTELVKVLGTRKDGNSYICGKCLAEEEKRRRAYYGSYWSPPSFKAGKKDEFDTADKLAEHIEWQAYEPTLTTKPFELVDIIEVCPGCKGVVARLLVDDNNNPSWNLYFIDRRGDWIAAAHDLAQEDKCPSCGYREWPPSKEVMARRREAYLRQAASLSEKYSFVSLSHISPAALVQNPTLLLELLGQASVLARLVDHLSAEIALPARTADRVREVNEALKLVLKRTGWYTNYGWVEPGDVLLYIAEGLPRQARVVTVTAGVDQVIIQLLDRGEYKTVPRSALAGSPHYIVSGDDKQDDTGNISGLITALDNHNLARYTYGVFYPESDTDFEDLVQEIKKSGRIVKVIALPPLDIKIRPLLEMFELRLPYAYLRQNASVAEVLADLKPYLGSSTIVVLDGAESLHSSAFPHLIGAADTLQEFVGFIIFSIRDHRAWEKKLNGMRMGNKLRHYALTINNF